MGDHEYRELGERGGVLGYLRGEYLSAAEKMVMDVKRGVL